MKKEHISLLSALVFLGIGITGHKWHFIGFGVTFLLIALANYLKHK